MKHVNKITFVLGIIVISSFLILYSNINLYAQKDLDLQSFENNLLFSLQKDPNNPDLNFDLGLLNKNMGNLESAYDYFQKVLTITENDSEALFWSGYILRQQNKLGLAASKLEKSLKINPQNHYAWYELGIINADRTYNEPAISCFIKAAEYSLNDKKIKEDAIYYIGLLYLNMKNIYKFYYYEKELRSLNPQKADYLKELAFLYQ
jgi:tetratricopeptide (TPR) repeat protein